MARLDGNTGAFVAGGAVVVLLALGVYIGLGPLRSTQVVQGLPAAVTPVETAQTPAPQPQIDTTAPRFDELRRETDGTTIIAGRAAPLSDVQIFVDGTEVASATADSTGGFAAIALVPPKDTAQIVRLTARDARGEHASQGEIILAPAATQPPAPQTQQAAAPDAVSSDAAELAATDPAANSDTAAALSQGAPGTVAPAQTATVLQSDAQGVRLLGAPAPETMSSVALDTIGYSTLGDVQLTGRAQTDTAKVRIYLDNRAVVTLPVDAQGRWRGDLPDVDEGIYTLRVDEVSTSGAVSSRVETPFKRESTQALADAAANTDGPLKSVTVQTGATLWAIARQRYGDGTLYLRVVEANADTIRNPDLIYPGQVFDLPN